MIDRDPSTLFYVRGPLAYSQDGLATMHNCDFMKDERFKRAYSAGERLDSWKKCKIHWRAHVLLWAASRAKDLEGDFVECGVNKGGFSFMIMRYLDFTNLPKKFYLLDTFCGLSERYISEQEIKAGIRAGGYDECFEKVRETFKDYANVEIIRGEIPGTLQLVKTNKVAFISIDMNCKEPEIAAAEYFWDKMVTGALMVLDDYGWRDHISQKEAFDKFAERKGIQILSLPTGQGLIIKS